MSLNVAVSSEQLTASHERFCSMHSLVASDNY